MRRVINTITANNGTSMKIYSNDPRSRKTVPTKNSVAELNSSGVQKKNDGHSRRSDSVRVP